MEIRQLKYFLKVAETLNFSEASRKLYITQSTLSQQISHLEQEIGLPLFERNSHEVYLTEAGKELRPYAQNAVNSAEACVDHMNDLKEMLTGELNIGVTFSFSNIMSETLCMAYGAEYDADVVIARLSHTYGPGFTESDNRVYAQFIRNVLKGEDIVLKSKGEAFRSWLYVVDAAHAILRLLLDGEKANAYNVAHSESNISIRQLAELIARKADRKVVFDIPEADAQQGNTTPITKATFSTDKLKALGWKPLFDVEEGFGHTLQEVREG